MRRSAAFVRLKLIAVSETASDAARRGHRVNCISARWSPSPKAFEEPSRVQTTFVAKVAEGTIAYGEPFSDAARRMLGMSDLPANAFRKEGAQV